MTWRISNASSTSPWAGGTTTLRSRARAGRRAFTLVELITVMAIMAILMAMIVGVAPRIQDAWRARLTRTRLLAVVTALQAYAEDYNGKYPWVANDGSMADVTAAAILGVDLSSAPSTYGVEGFTKAEVVLYGALTSARRRGPYYKGAGGQTVVRKGTGDQEFTLFADGWERPIRYLKPQGSKATTPLLISAGSNGTFDYSGDSPPTNYPAGTDDIASYKVE